MEFKMNPEQVIEFALTTYINKTIRECQETHPLTNSIQAKLNDRMFRAFGRWIAKRKNNQVNHTIEIASKVFKNITPELKDTIIHEYAHAYAWEKYNDNGHGYYWKMVFTQMGGSGETYVSQEKQKAVGYNIKELKNQMTKHIYTCTCQKEFKISPQKHNKIQKGNNYVCNSCRTRIVYTNKVVKV